MLVFRDLGQGGDPHSPPLASDTLGKVGQRLSTGDGVRPSVARGRGITALDGGASTLRLGFRPLSELGGSQQGVC